MLWQKIFKYSNYICTFLIYWNMYYLRCIKLRVARARLCCFRFTTSKTWTGLPASSRRPIQWCSVLCTASMKLFLMSRSQLVHSFNELWDRPAGIPHITVWRAGIATTKFPGNKAIIVFINNTGHTGHNTWLYNCKFSWLMYLPKLCLFFCIILKY